MFSQPLLTVTLIEMMKLWGDLVECYHGVNAYGGYTAEIYAYRLQSYSPVDHNASVMTDLKAARTAELNTMAANALASLCEEFARQYECKIYIDGRDLPDWLMAIGDQFDHRVHVEVMS